MSTLTIDDVTARPWQYSAAQWQIAHNVKQPFIAEISPMQYAHLSKRGKREYDRKREEEWSASAQCKNKWERAVIDASDAGQVIKADAHPDAWYVIIRERIRRDKEKEEQQRQTAHRANQYSSVDEIESGQQVYYLIYSQFGTVIRRNKRTVTVDFGGGHRPTIPPHHLYRTNPREITNA